VFPSWRKTDDLVDGLETDPAGAADSGTMGTIAVVVVALTLLTTFALRWIAPAASLGCVGGVVGGVSGFLTGAADGPPLSPASAAAGASLGVLAFSVIGLIVTTDAAPRRARRRFAALVAVAGLSSVAILSAALLRACPLYVDGSGYCSYDGVVVLGGWLSGVVALAVLDVVVIGSVILVSDDAR
jgi:hypothetical protein